MKHKFINKLFAGLLLLLSLLTPLSALADVTIDGEHFPDEKFRNYLLAQDYGQDEIITNEEIAGITMMNVSYRQILSLEGIQYFTALTSLNCSYNQLTSLDVSQNTELTMLYCQNNELTNLDVSNCTRLTNLLCFSNKMTRLNVSGCTALATLACHDNLLESLDLSQNTAITWLDCNRNHLTSLDVSDCSALTTLQCYNNQLTSLEVSGCTTLTYLSCYSNQLASLDVSECTALTYVSSYSNQLMSLNVSGCTKLSDLRCYSNQLTDLDVSGCTALVSLYCYKNQLTSLYVSDCTALTTLSCYNNQIYGEQMDKFIESLPNNNGIIYIYNNQGSDNNICTWNQADAITAKGWTAYRSSTKYDGLTEWAIDLHEGQGEYWVTLYAPFGYTLPEGAEAYIGAVNEKASTLVLTSIGRDVPRGTPVIIKGNSSKITAKVDDNTTAEIRQNDLSGQYAAYTEPVSDVYALGIYDDIVGLYKYTGIIGKFKAVLRLPEGAKASNYKLVFGEDDITAIEDVSAAADTLSTTYHDLQGRRVAEPQKGQIYIVNGKTIVY